MATPRENRKKQARSEANMLTASDRPIEVAIWFIVTDSIHPSNPSPSVHCHWQLERRWGSLSVSAGGRG
ncbi:hypothetical protein ASPCAL01095 [Aspergillus calidoustus]|uniref:Uncharacterized protein n=1 Tax=Aspergillus calidoustus TaxID=454130 RepID=A0A0U5C2S7_ASPCI|nr:hypothetical protein ASPCAL01095 [Aspergillus calidoustus]